MTLKSDRLLNIIMNTHRVEKLIEHLDYKRLMAEREFTILPLEGTTQDGKTVGPHLGVVLNILFDLDYHQYTLLQVWDHALDVPGDPSANNWFWVMLWWPHADPPELVHVFDSYPSFAEAGAIVDRECWLLTAEGRASL